VSETSETPAVDLTEIVEFNKQQATHIRMVQEMVQEFCHILMRDALEHDQSKWNENEYSTFVASRKVLNQSADGKDAEYQKWTQNKAIQSHINHNPHHPEYWERIGFEMPLQDAIIMFFDWYARSKQRGTDFNQFWPYNVEKLKNQPRALAVVELLRKRYCPG